MIGKKVEFDDEQLRCLIEEEFKETVGTWNETAIGRARAALTAYESVGEFLEDTGWGKDNPEIAGEAYLTGNRICRLVDGKFLYLSRFLWENQEGGGI